MQAYFVFRPRRLSDLQIAHLIEEEHLFEIVATVELSAIDYENFSEDLSADRQFIEDYAEKCKEGKVYSCIFIKRKRYPDGVLVLPYKECFVKYAAYYIEARY